VGGAHLSTKELFPTNADPVATASGSDTALRNWFMAFMQNSRIGTCGFGIAREKYVQIFSCVEVQHTFYQPPRLTTLERWREEAPPDFEFVLKAWQLITHEAKSPTYRRLKKKLSVDEKQDAGYFRLTPIVKEAWEVTIACANALQATTILFQCPASFKQSEENISNMEKFFSTINRQEHVDKQLNFCWEPRGDWDSKVVKATCERLNLWHVVDPFAANSVTPERPYFRLHGRNGWRYEYHEDELLELAEMLPKRLSKGGKAYLFFNNVSMTKDALKFQAITGGK
jgi:uncharacterized protein YecE (DUF72 family)